MREKLLSEGNKTNYAYLILSGGENSRMGGENKLFLKVAGRRQLERLLSCIRETESYLAGQKQNKVSAVREKVFLSVKQEEKSPEYAGCGLTCIPDPVSRRGPIAGIISGLRYLKEEKYKSDGEDVPEAFLVLSSDLFDLEKEVLITLIEAYRKTGRPVFYRSKDGLPAPFPGVYTTDMEPEFSAALAGEAYQLRNLIQECIARQGCGLLPDAPDCFFKIRNLNTPEAVKRAEERYRMEEKEGERDE